jgi:hypothetical protein
VLSDSLEDVVNMSGRRDPPHTGAASVVSAPAAFVDELAEVGLSVESSWDLVNTRRPGAGSLSRGNAFAIEWALASAASMRTLIAHTLRSLTLHPSTIARSRSAPKKAACCRAPASRVAAGRTGRSGVAAPAKPTSPTTATHGHDVLRTSRRGHGLGAF